MQVWLYRKLASCSPDWLCHNAFPPAMGKSPRCSAPSPALGIISCVNSCRSSLSHSSRCAGVSHCYFNSRFPTDYKRQASFHVLICHLSSFVKCLSKCFAYFSFNCFHRPPSCFSVCMVLIAPTCRELLFLGKSPRKMLGGKSGKLSSNSNSASLQSWDIRTVHFLDLPARTSLLL